VQNPFEEVMEGSEKGAASDFLKNWEEICCLRTKNASSP
jgi:hypothetical protein